MSEGIDGVISAYNMLSNPCCPDPNSCTNYLLQFYHNANSFSTILQIISSNANEKIVNHAIVGLGIFIRFNFQSIPDKSSYFESLLPLIAFPSSLYVRKNARYYIQTSMSADSFAPVIEYVQHLCQTRSPIDLEAALYLISMSFIYDETYVPNHIDFITSIIQAGFASGSIETEIAAESLSISINANLPSDSPLLSSSFSSSLALLESAAHSCSESEISDICKPITYIADSMADFMDPQALLSTCLKLIADRSVPTKSRYYIRCVSDTVIADFSDSIIGNQEIYSEILNAYFTYATDSYCSEECFSVADHSAFTNIGPALGQDDEFLDLLLEAVSQSSEPAYIFASCSALLFTFSANPEYYSEKVESVTSYLLNTLKSDSIGLRSVAAVSIGEMADFLKESLDDVIDTIASSVLLALEETPIPLIVSCLGKVVANLGNSDKIFEKCLNLLCQCLNTGDPEMQLSVFVCISELTKKPSGNLKKYMTQILQITLPIAESNNPSDSFLIPPAITCLSHLIASIGPLFEPYAQVIAGFLASNLANPESSISYEAMKAFGTLSQNYPASCESLMDQAIPILIGIASKDVIAKADTDNFMGDNEEEDDEDLVMQNVGASISVVCCIISCYPNLLPIYFGQISAAIVKQIQISTGVGEPGCAKGITFLVQAFQKVEKSPEIVSISKGMFDLLANVYSDSGNSDAVGEGLSAAADIISLNWLRPSEINMQPILEAIKEVFKGEMIFQEGKVAYDESVHPQAQQVLREMMCAWGDSSLEYLQPFIEIMKKLLKHKSPQMKDLSLQFFGDMVLYMKSLSPEFKIEIIEDAISASQSRKCSVAFGVFKSFAISSPQELKERLPKVMALIKKNIGKGVKRSEAQMTVMDNCISALAEIAINLMGEEFPVDEFLSISLDAMPAQVEVEENPDIFKFYEWLFDRTGGNPAEEFAAVLIRLFSDSLDKLPEFKVDKQMIGKLLPLLKQLREKVGNFENLVAQIAEEDEDKIGAVNLAIAAACSNY